MAAKRRMPFKKKHDLEYGFQVVTGDNKNRTVGFLTMCCLWGFICRLRDLTGVQRLLTAIQMEKIDVSDGNSFQKDMFVLRKDNVLAYINK